MTHIVIHTTGYDALTEYLVEHLALFEKTATSAQQTTTEQVVTDLIANQIMTLFAQNPAIEQDRRFQLLQEADAVLADLHQILEGMWLQSPSKEQIHFLEEFIFLLKNLFDTAIEAG